MSRPVTSNVSALWGFVANGHQAVHHVSSSPSEIPYGGFSPVRLQTGLSNRHLRRDSAYRRPAILPVLAQVALAGSYRLLGGASARSVRTLRSRGPWLGCGLFCPAASSLTMASSELLSPSRQVMASTGGSLLVARTEKVPDLSCMSFDPCRLPYPGGSGGRDCCSSTRGSLRPFC
jgi:hypothetical protein